MKPQVKIEEMHKRTVSAFFDRRALTRLVAQSVASEASLDLDDRAVTYKVVFEDEKEGSPSYVVGTKAKVEIVVDLGGEARS